MKKITLLLALVLITWSVNGQLMNDYNTFFALGATGSGVLENGGGTVGTWNLSASITGGSNPTLTTNNLSYSDGSSVNYIDNAASYMIPLSNPAAARTSIYYLSSSGLAVSTTYYLSFLINLSTAPSSVGTMLNFNNSSTGASAYGRIYIKSSGSGFVLSTGAGGNTSGYSSVLAFGTTHLLVLKYVYTSTTSQDCYLFINPSVGGTEGSPTLSGTNNTSTVSAVKGLAITQLVGLTGNLGSLRLGKAWSDVAKGKLNTPSVTTGATSITSSGCRANWSSVASASSYTVTVYNENNSINQTITGISNSATYTDITGLSASSNYTYKVTAVGNGTSILDSNQSAAVSFSTSASASPTLSVGTLTAFGGQTLNTTAGPNSFTITGTNLTTADVTVGALSGYTYSTTSNGTYSSTLTILQSGGSFSQTIYVKFTPTAAQSYNGNIPVGGGGATSVNCATSGSGISGEPTSQATNVTFSNLISTGSTTSGVTINWTVGDGANHIVLVKAASAVDSNPVDATSYTASTTFGSGTQIGTGNYVVFAGSGTSVAVTGLTKGTTYYVKVFSYNNSGGSENYLTTSPASGSQLALGTITSTASGNWGTAGTWVGGVAPGINDNVVIAGGHVVDLNSNSSCYNLTINSGGKLWATASKTLSLYGSSLVCNGTLGDASNTASLLNISYANSLTISGSGSIYPYRILPVASVSNIGVTFDAPVTVTYGTVGVLTENGTSNDNITYTVNAGKTVTVNGAFSTTSSQTGVGSGNVTLNVYGALSIGGTLNTTVNSGKTYTVNVYNGGLIEVAKTNSTKAFNVCPVHAVQNASFTINAGGEIKVYGIADCSNTTYSGTVTGAGTFSLLSGATITLAAVAGLDPVNGPIRTTTRSFDTAANYSFVGTSAQSTGSDLPATMNNMTINNAAGVTLGKNITVNGVLNLTAGALDNNSKTVTMANLGTINNYGGSITSAPALGSNINFVYGGSSPVTLSSDFAGSATINALTVNNTAGVTLTSNLTNVGNLTIGTGGILNVNAGKQLTVSTALTNNGSLNLLSDENGTATYLDPTNSTGTGTATVQQHLTSGRNWYMTTPIASATGANLLTRAGEVVCYNEATGVWDPVISGTALNPLRGYISAATASTGTVSFTGTLNTGEKYIDLTRTNTATKPGFNLVGNPYPSYISWDAATKTNLEPTVWFRSRNAGNTAYIFDTYNATTHVGTGLNGSTLTTYIPPMQAFWVRVSAGQTTGRLTLDNTMRSHGSGSNKMKVPALTDQQLLRLKVSNSANEDEAILVFNPNASNSYDLYDSQKQSNANKAIPEIYTLAGNEEVVINGLNNVNATPTLALGFRTGEYNTFSIRASEMSNFGNNIRIVLKDNALNTETDLTDGANYTFISDITNTTDRFTLLFKAPATVTGFDNNTNLNNNLICLNNNKQLVVQKPGNSIQSISIYNTTGQLIEMISAQTALTKSMELKAGVYFVQIRNKNNENTVCKVKVD